VCERERECERARERERETVREREREREREKERERERDYRPYCLCALPQKLSNKKPKLSKSECHTIFSLVQVMVY
jgi:hypothetical protein